MNDSALKEWLKLSDVSKLELFSQTSDSVGLPVSAIEKDWWVTHTLSIIFSMSCANALVFKGGTSLSKAWNLIERFSEDIDLVLDREYLGFTGELSKKKIHKLRYASYDFLTTKFIRELGEQFNTLGFADVVVKYRETVNHDQDPLIIEIYYPKLTEKEIYLQPGILVEVGSRSLKEPYTQRILKTMVSEIFSNTPFTDQPITIPTVNPERTFLEKIFLLHEEFQRPPQKIRVERLSRHLYDIEKLSQTPYFQKALTDKDLYQTIIAHRRQFSALEGVDYEKHLPSYIKIVPPKHLLPIWEKDYNEMGENMIYGKKLTFNELILKITEIQSIVNAVQWSE
ncbi:MAG: nucleotidyl transferase AbiEii/AbiGii toxin family protein [Lentimicrobiaceae bacterium]|nr:nucleotidyl transferase AbiEii/AbiGii toxin family protein [Lentimicrobiaceae bacterium]